MVDREGLPTPSGPEIAFAGRSNAGKIQLNQPSGRADPAGLCQQNAWQNAGTELSRPGGGYLVDLPGYGLPGHHGTSNGCGPVSLSSIFASET